MKSKQPCESPYISAISRLAALAECVEKHFADNKNLTLICLTALDRCPTLKAPFTLACKICTTRLPLGNFHGFHLLSRVFKKLVKDNPNSYEISAYASRNARESSVHRLLLAVCSSRDPQTRSNALSHFRELSDPMDIFAVLHVLRASIFNGDDFGRWTPQTLKSILGAVQDRELQTDLTIYALKAVRTFYDKNAYLSLLEEFSFHFLVWFDRGPETCRLLSHVCAAMPVTEPDAAFNPLAQSTTIFMPSTPLIVPFSTGDKFTENMIRFHLARKASLQESLQPAFADPKCYLACVYICQRCDLLVQWAAHVFPRRVSRELAEPVLDAWIVLSKGEVPDAIVPHAINSVLEILGFGAPSLLERATESMVLMVKRYPAVAARELTSQIRDFRLAPWPRSRVFKGSALARILEELFKKELPPPAPDPLQYVAFAGSAICWIVREGESPDEWFLSGFAAVKKFLETLGGNELKIEPKVDTFERVAEQLISDAQRAAFDRASSLCLKYSLPWCLHAKPNDLREAMNRNRTRDLETFVHTAIVFIRQNGQNCSFLTEILNEKNVPLGLHRAILRVITLGCRFVSSSETFEKLLDAALFDISDDRLCDLRNELGPFVTAFANSDLDYRKTVLFILGLPRFIRDYPRVILKIKELSFKDRIKHLTDLPVTAETIAERWFKAMQQFPTTSEYEEEDNRFHSEMVEALLQIFFESKLKNLDKLLHSLWRSFRNDSENAPIHYVRCALQIQKKGLSQRHLYPFEDPSDFLILAEQVLCPDPRVCSGAIEFFKNAYNLKNQHIRRRPIPDRRVYPTERIRGFYGLFLDLFDANVLDGTGRTEKTEKTVSAECLMNAAASDCSKLSNVLICCCLLETTLGFASPSFRTFCSGCRDYPIARVLAISAINAQFTTNLPESILWIITKGADNDLIDRALVELLSPPPIPRRSAHDLHATRLIARVYLDLILISNQLVRDDHKFYFLTKLVDSCATVYADSEVRAKVFLCILLLGARAPISSSQQNNPGESTPLESSLTDALPTMGLDREVKRFARDHEQLAEFLRRLVISSTPISCRRDKAVTRYKAVALVRDWIMGFAGELALLNIETLSRICVEIEYAQHRHPASWSSAVFGGLLCRLAADGSITAVKIELFRHATVPIWQLVADIFNAFQQPNGQEILPLVSVFARVIRPAIIKELKGHAIQIFKTILLVTSSAPNFENRRKYPLNALSVMLQYFPPGQPDPGDIETYCNLVGDFKPPDDGKTKGKLTRSIVGGLKTIVQTRGRNAGKDPWIDRVVMLMIETPGRYAVVMDFLKAFYGKESDEEVLAEAVQKISKETEGRLLAKAPKSHGIQRLNLFAQNVTPGEFVWLRAIAKYRRDNENLPLLKSAFIRIAANPSHECYQMAVEAIEKDL